jgi:hypothetical protein
MKAKLMIAALAFVVLSSAAFAQEKTEKAGCCKEKTECCKAKEECSKTKEAAPVKSTDKKAGEKKVVKSKEAKTVKK